MSQIDFSELSKFLVFVSKHPTDGSVNGTREKYNEMEEFIENFCKFKEFLYALKAHYNTKSENNQFSIFNECVSDTINEVIDKFEELKLDKAF